MTRQQMRNSLYSGAGTRFLKQEAGTGLFLEATGGSLRTSSMRDREFVNRFCGFQLLPLDIYRGEMDDFLAEALTRMKKMEAAELSRLSTEFRNGLSNNLMVFGEHAFRKHFEGQTRRSVIMLPCGISCPLASSRFPPSVVKPRADDLRDELHALMEDDGFVASITYGTNDTRRVNHRFDAASVSSGRLSVLNQLDLSTFKCFELLRLPLAPLRSFAEPTLPASLRCSSP